MRTEFCSQALTELENHSGSESCQEFFLKMTFRLTMIVQASLFVAGLGVFRWRMVHFVQLSFVSYSCLVPRVSSSGRGWFGPVSRGARVCSLQLAQCFGNCSAWAEWPLPARRGRSASNGHTPSGFDLPSQCGCWVNHPQFLTEIQLIRFQEVSVWAKRERQL